MKYQLFPNLTADEMESLTDDIRQRGVMVPVEVDEAGDILDGHHRAMIADSLGIQYPKVVREGWSEDQKLAQVIALNAHRRHLSGGQRDDVLRGLRHRGMSIPAIQTASGESRGVVQRAVSGLPTGNPDERVTGQDGKSYAAFRPRLDPAPDAYFADRTDGSLALAPEPVSEPAWAPSSGLMSSDSAEWYTPKRVLDAVVAAMGGIDLDPCADPGRSVPATTHYVEADDGLAQDWTGRVYMNPPYGRGIDAWVAKLAAAIKTGAVTEAIALLPGRIETDWFYAVEAAWLCNIEGRLAFSGHPNAAPFPSVAAYIGPNGDAFADAFVSLGDVYERRRRFVR